MLITRSLSDLLATSSPSPAASIVFSSAGSVSHLASASAADCSLVGPLHRAAKRPRRGDRHGLAGEHRVERVARVVRLGLGRIFVVVDPAAETQLAIAVEEKDVRRRDRAVCLRHRLRLAVVEIREVELVVAGADLHVVERVAKVGVAELVEPHRRRIVRRNRHHRDAAILVVGGQLFDPLFVRLGGRAMIAGEDDRQDVGVGEIGERVGLVVDARQREVGCRGTDCAGSWRRPR